MQRNVGRTAVRGSSFDGEPATGRGGGAVRRGVLGESAGSGGRPGRGAIGESTGRGVAGRGVSSRAATARAGTADGVETSTARGTASRPLGRAGRRRDDDDRLEDRPDYLVESDEVWGDGRRVARRVLGERPELDGEDL